MRKILSVFILFLAIVGCSNNENKAKDIVINKIKSELPNGYQYIPVSFSTYSDVLSNIEDEGKYQELKSEYDKAEYQYIYDSVSIAEYGGDSDEIESMKISLLKKDKLAEGLFNLEKVYNPRVLGKGIVHTYICETNFGDSIYFEKYIFDNKLNVIYNKKESYLIDKDSISSIVEKENSNSPVDVNAYNF